MPVSSLTEALDNFYTTTWQNMKSNVADQIFDGTPFWFWLRDRGKLKIEQGGRFLTEPLRYAKSDRVGFIGRGGTVQLSENEFLTTAYYNWRYLVDSMVRFGVDDQQNRGRNRIISIATAKMDQSKDSLADKLESVLFAKEADEADSFLGLQDLVADDPTTGTVGNINAATHSWWRNQVKDMTGSSFGVNGVVEMRTMLNDCGKNLRNATPDIIVSGQTPYEYYEDATLEQKRIVNQKLGDAGFENIQFKGIPMIWSPSCANTRMYFLNTNFLNFTYDPMMFFDMTEWKPIPDQVNDRAAQIILAGNLVTSRRRVHGVLFNINTA
jgi:hypothetical protein